MSAPASVPNDFNSVNRTFETEVIANGNFSALNRVYTQSARILPPGAEMITGLEHIQAFWQQAISTMGVQSIKLSTVDLDIVGDTAVEIGRAELGTAHPASPTVVKYVVIWKQEEGGWKWHIDIWNAAS
jgi:ketosteroid isomerase-like protein